MRPIYSTRSPFLVLIIISFCTCADTIEQSDDMVTQVNAEEPGIIYEWPSDPNTAGNRFTEIVAGDPMAGEPSGGQMGGEAMGGGSTGGEPIAGEAMIDIMMAGEMTAGDSGSVYPSYAVEMLGYVNQFRQTGGRCGNQDLPSAAPLELHPLLNQAALAHAEDMAINNYFDHNSQDGRSPGDRIAATGYRGNGYGENIAAGRGDALSTFEQWKNSPGHCVNMLRGRFNELGVGYYNQSGSQFRHYWVQKFSTR